MFNVILFCQEPLKTIALPITEIEPFTELVRRYGYQDSEGYEYNFEHAQVDDDGSLTIYLEENN